MHKTLGSISSYTQIVTFLLVIIVLNFVTLVMERGLHSCLTSPSPSPLQANVYVHYCRQRRPTASRKNLKKLQRPSATPLSSWLPGSEPLLETWARVTCHIEATCPSWYFKTGCQILFLSSLGSGSACVPTSLDILALLCCHLD